MAISRRFSDRDAQAGFFGNAQNADYYSYDKVTLDDVINNFIVAYIGAGKVLPKVPRHEVAFWAQRGLQELSYDTLESDKSMEFELSEALSFPLPGDYVNYIKFTFTDNSGTQRTILPARISTAHRGVMQDQDYTFLYDEDGNILNEESSIGTRRFQTPDQADTVRDREFQFDGDELYDYYYSGYFGRQYGLDPEQSNQNGQFIIDMVSGIVYFDGTFAQNHVISMRYVSDGLAANGDLTTAFVHKFAEEALYNYVLYNLAKVRTATVQIAAIYKKEASASMRNAKIRLSNYRPEEISQILRGRAKWIKH